MKVRRLKLQELMNKEENDSDQQNEDKSPISD